MLHITSLKLTDFGRHKHIDAKFGGHVVGLTGPNGLGKSTILQALQLAYTGSIETSPAEPLSNFIRQSTGDNPPKFAEVESTFLANGKEGRIVRRITRTSVTRKLYWDGAEKPITSDKEVSKLLADIMGVDKKAINSTVFIRQGEMDSMFGLDTDRRDFYTKLLMLGHLAKVASVIETFRVQVASTVQDLGAARDAATATYESALTYRDTTELELASCPPRAGELVVAQKVLAAFEERDVAADAVARAEKLLSATGGDANALPPMIKELEDTEELRAQLSARKSKHMRSSSDATACAARLEELRRHAQLFADAQAVQDQIAALPSAGDDPSEDLRKAEGSIVKLDRLDELTQSVPKLKDVAVNGEASVARLKEVADARRETCDAYRSTYAAEKSRLDMRRDLLAALKSTCSDHDYEGCPLCGSATQPDEARLLRDIEEGAAQLEVVTQKGRDAAALLKSADDSYQSESRALQVSQSKLASDEKELARLRVELMLTTRSAAEESIAMLKIRQQEFAAATFEHQRLERELATRKHLVVGKSLPTDNDIAIAASANDDAAAALASATWSSQDSSEETEAEHKARQLRASIDTLRNQLTTLSSANQRYESAYASLTAAVGAAPEGFFADVMTGDASLTAAEAEAKVVQLTSQQSEHDTARGRREAAGASLKAASRKIDELDLRTAEQRHRLALVKDLELLRETFKPTGASLEYLNYKFGQIATMAADYLAESGADFMVAPSEEIPLAFEFLRTDRENEAWLPQNRLSGGQKVRLAVATLRAIHSLVIPDVGLLVLDEPTTHLDDEVKRSMADMLRGIGDEGTLQMIVCDHSPILIDAFSDILSIPA